MLSDMSRIKPGGNLLVETLAAYVVLETLPTFVLLCSADFNFLQMVGKMLVHK